MGVGPPIDDEADYALNIWAGVVPLSLKVHPPITDLRLTPRSQPPTYVRRYRYGGEADREVSE